MAVQDLILRRQRLVDLHDRARERWPYTHAEFARAMHDVTDGLQAVATEFLDSRDAPPTEIARSHMWLGDALFDLAQGRHTPFARAIAAYRTAEPYVRISHDRLLGAKFDTNLGNILFRDNQASAVLEDVIQRYERALPVLAAQAPTSAQQVRVELARAKQLLGEQRKLAAEMQVRRLELQDWIASRPFPPSACREDAEAFAAALRELEGAHADAERTGDFAAALRLMERARSAFQRLMSIASSPARGPRGRLSAVVMKLWSELAAASMTAQADLVTRDRAFELMPLLLESNGVVMNGSDADVVALCARRLLPVAAEARKLLGRSLLTWATPLWPVGSSPEHPNGLYVTSAKLRARIAPVGAELGLDVLEVSAGVELAEGTFDAIRRAAIVVADVAADPSVRAAACYEIGIALVLGKPLVVVAPRNAGLPFDIDIAPLAPPDNAQALELLRDALLCALLLPQRQPDSGTLTLMLGAARRVFHGQPAGVDEIERSIGAPLEAEAALANVVRQDAIETGTQRVVVHSTWMRGYPAPQERRLFHVMPFSARWSDHIKGQTSAVCEEHGVPYRRGDDVEDQRVIRSIWDELCLASHVLVDLTGVNPNVTLELGIAHALGKSVLAVGQKGTVPILFPALKKVRVSEYDLDDDRYRTLVARFLDHPQTNE